MIYDLFDSIMIQYLAVAAVSVTAIALSAFLPKRRKKHAKNRVIAESSAPVNFPRELRIFSSFSFSLLPLTSMDEQMNYNWLHFIIFSRIWTQNTRIYLRWNYVLFPFAKVQFQPLDVYQYSSIDFESISFHVKMLLFSILTENFCQALRNRTKLPVLLFNPFFSLSVQFARIDAWLFAISSVRKTVPDVSIHSMRVNAVVAEMLCCFDANESDATEALPVSDVRFRLEKSI